MIFSVYQNNLNFSLPKQQFCIWCSRSKKAKWPGPMTQSMQAHVN